MKYIGCYDDTEVLIETICDELDITEPELVDMLLDEIDEYSELGQVIKRAIGGI